MISFNKKNKIRSIFLSPFVVGICVFLAFYAIYRTIFIYKKLLNTNAEVEIAKKKYLEVYAQSQLVYKNIDDFESTQGVEKRIRAKYGLAKEGENLAVVIIGSKDNISKEKEQSFVDKIFSFILFK